MRLVLKDTGSKSNSAMAHWRALGFGPSHRGFKSRLHRKTVSCFGIVLMGMAREPKGPTPASQATPLAAGKPDLSVSVFCAGGGVSRGCGTQDAQKASTATMDSKVVLQRVHTPRVVGSIPIPNGALFRAMPVETGLHIRDRL